MPLDTDAAVVELCLYVTVSPHAFPVISTRASAKRDLSKCFFIVIKDFDLYFGYYFFRNILFRAKDKNKFGNTIYII